MTIKQLAGFERSVCACQQCKAFCHNRPGCLAPADIDHIAAHFGMESPTDDFVLKNFVATLDGPTTANDEHVDGDTFALRPAKKEDGSCVFLGSQGQCTIHPVAPFECRMTRDCDPVEGAAAMKALGKAILGSVDYQQHWAWVSGKHAVTQQQPQQP